LITLGACATQRERTEEPTAIPAVEAPARNSGSNLAADQAADLARFQSWFAGEWDNNEQVWQQMQTPEEQRSEPLSEHTHHVFAPISAPQIGAHTYFVEQYLDADPSKVYRRRLYSFNTDGKTNAIRLDIFSFKDEARFAGAHRKAELFSTLSSKDLTNVPGCAVYWRFDPTEQAFHGTMPKDACQYFSPRLNKTLIVNDTLRLSADQLLLDDRATDPQGQPVFGKRNSAPLHNRKVKYFDGWAVINRAGVNAKGSDTKFRLIRPLRMHNEGQKIQLTWEDGTPTGYTIELAQLTYQETKVPILKLALIDDATGKSFAYSWADKDAKRVGFNIKWFQAGFTLKEKNPAIGWD